jgi:hypothetical protein
MSRRLTPVKREQFIQRLRELGFDGPFPSCAIRGSHVRSGWDESRKARNRMEDTGDFPVAFHDSKLAHLGRVG